SPLSAPVSGVLRFLYLLCFALPLLAVSARAASAPSVATIARAQPGPVTTGSSLKWRVTFTEAVTGVDPTDFALTLADAPDTSFPVTAGLITVTAGANAAEYFVTATGVAGVGTLRLDVKTGGTGIADALGHVMTEGYIYGQPYTHALGTVPVVWGKNNYGQLGLGSSDTAAHSLPVFVPNTGVLAGKTVVALAVGGGHTLALTSEGKVYAWGRNEAGQVGNGTTDSPTPVEVIGLGVPETTKVVAIAAGGSHSVALDSDGHVYSWGWNNYGQLGSDTPSGSSYSRSTTPAAAKVDSSSALHGKTVVGIAAGMNYTLALCSDGTLAAWGYNNYGQLGNGTSTGSATPTPVAVVRDIGSALHGKTVVAMAAGSRHSAALCSDGTVATWGQSGSGELGDGTTGDGMSRSTIPVAVKADSSSALHGKTVVGVALGASHALALCADGDGALSLASWGMNNYGQLGIGTLETPKATPMAVKTDSSSALSGKTVVGLAVGSYHSLALCADGTLATWGRNDSGQLGALRTAAAAGDIMAVREAFGRLRERHPQSAALAPFAHAIETFDTDGLVRLTGPAGGPSPES
ncbi:MAG: hypothetical protein KBG39_09470, partial [Opitutaceae bacterium]|nr:hypothetical protein [Opitutaceae bacterium]